MIYGIGTDIVAVSRLRGMWERHGDRLLDKILAPQEMDIIIYWWHIANL